MLIVRQVQPAFPSWDREGNAFLKAGLYQPKAQESALGCSLGLLVYVAEFRNFEVPRTVSSTDREVLNDCSDIILPFQTTQLLQNADAAPVQGATIQCFVERLYSISPRASMFISHEYRGLSAKSVYVMAGLESCIQEVGLISTPSHFREPLFRKNTDDYALIKSVTIYCPLEWLYALSFSAQLLILRVRCGGTHLQAQHSYYRPAFLNFKHSFPLYNCHLQSLVAGSSVSIARIEGTHLHSQQLMTFVGPEPTPPDPQPPLPPYK